MAEDTLSSEFYWDNVVFKVEDKLFCVPRYEFVQSSEVFADMFALPSGCTASNEGQDREHPIVLEGYKKNEFSCLLKVMYPTAGSLISGTKLDLCLKKEEWVSVLKLSTIWNMIKIRNYAIHRLSNDFVLSPIEKVLLARAHKVAAWLEEGVISLASANPKPALVDLAKLGWETAARILWIRDLSDSTTLHLRRDAIKCGYCSSSASLIIGNYTCNKCGGAVPPDAELTLHVPGSASGTFHLVVKFREIMCKCGQSFHTPGSTHCSCFGNFYDNDKARITANRRENKEGMIEEMFGEEINDYELAMAFAYSLS